MCDAEFIRGRITALRMRKNVSSQKMGLQIGLSESYINKIELGRAYPSWPAFFKICEYLCISPKDFFDEDTSNPALLNDLITEARKLDDESLEYMIGIARKMCQ